MNVLEDFEPPRKSGAYVGFTDELKKLKKNSCIVMDEGATHGGAYKMVRQAQKRKKNPVRGTFRVMNIDGIVHVWRTS